MWIPIFLKEPFMCILLENNTYRAWAHTHARTHTHTDPLSTVSSGYHLRSGSWKLHWIVNLQTVNGVRGSGSLLACSRKRIQWQQLNRIQHGSPQLWTHTMAPPTLPFWRALLLSDGRCCIPEASRHPQRAAKITDSQEDLVVVLLPLSKQICG